MADQFKERAGGWDEIPWKKKLAQEAYTAICSKIEIHPDTRLIDFGGGTGLLTLKFTTKVSKITIIDTSEAMLGVLREKIKTQNLSNIEIMNEVLLPGKLPPNSYDLIISMLTLHHIDDLDTLFQTFHDLLVSDGKIALIDLAREDGNFHPKGTEYVHNGFQPETLKIPLENAGFKNIDIEEFVSVTKEPDSGNPKKYPILLVLATKHLLC